MTEDDWREWDGELDDVELAPPAVPTPAPPVEQEELWAPRYPRPQRRTPPPGLTRRQGRRWRRDVHRDEREQRNRTAAGWRRNRGPGALNGLGIVVLAAVLALATAVWLRAVHHDTPGHAPTPVAETAARANPGPSSVGTTTPAPTASTPAAAVGTDTTGTDDLGRPIPPAGLFDDPAGQGAYAFLLGYLTYSPAVPDPVGTWVHGWSAHATAELATTAAAQSTPLWDFTVQRAVHVTSPRVLSGSRDGDTWTLHAAWTLFPIGGDETTQLIDEQLDVVLVAPAGIASQVTVTRAQG